MFVAIAGISNADGSRLRWASMIGAGIVMRRTARDDDRAIMRSFGGRRSWAVIFTISDQRARTDVAFGRWNGHAFLARTQMAGDGVARIALASIMFAATIVITIFRDATFAAATRIRATIRWFALAFQFRTRAIIGTVLPFIFAVLRRLR